MCQAWQSSSVIVNNSSCYYCKHKVILQEMAKDAVFNIMLSEIAGNAGHSATWNDIIKKEDWLLKVRLWLVPLVKVHV